MKAGSIRFKISAGVSGGTKGQVPGVRKCQVTAGVIRVQVLAGVSCQQVPAGSRYPYMSVDNRCQVSSGFIRFQISAGVR